MAEVSQLQLTLADNIKTSMARIDATMAGEASPQGQDAEVEAWRRKIEELSAPLPQCRQTCTVAAPSQHLPTASSASRTVDPPGSDCRSAGCGVDPIAHSGERMPVLQAVADPGRAPPPRSLVRRCFGCLWAGGDNDAKVPLTSEPTENDDHQPLGRATATHYLD